MATAKPRSQTPFDIPGSLLLFISCDNCSKVVMLSYLLLDLVKVFSIALLTYMSLTTAVQPNETPLLGQSGACRTIIFKFELFVKVPTASNCTEVCSGYFKDFDYAIQDNLGPGRETCLRRSHHCRKSQKVSTLPGAPPSSFTIAKPAEASTSKHWLQLGLAPPVSDVICKCEHAVLVYRVRKLPASPILASCEPLAMCERLTILRLPEGYHMHGKIGQLLEPRKWQCLIWDMEERAVYPRIIDDNVSCAPLGLERPDYVPWCSTCNAPMRCNRVSTISERPSDHAGPSHISGEPSLERDFYECPVLYPFDAAAYKTVAQRKTEARQKARDQNSALDQETQHAHKKQRKGKAKENAAGVASARESDAYTLDESSILNGIPQALNSENIRRFRQYNYPSLVGTTTFVSSSIWSTVTRTASMRADAGHSLGASNIVLSRFPFLLQPSPWPSDDGASTSAAGGSGRNHRGTSTAGNQRSTDTFQFGRISQTSQELQHMDSFQRITSSADGSGPSLARPYTGNVGNPSVLNLHLLRGPLRSAAALPSLTLGLATDTVADELLAGPTSADPPNADCEDPAAADDDAVGFL